MVRSLLFCMACAVAAALLSLSPLGQRAEREIGLGLLYGARGNLEPPEGALVIGLDRDSVGWLQRNVDALDALAEGLDGCLTRDAREELRQARNINHIPRALHNCLIRRLARRGPRVIVFDINFNAETPDDDDLAEAIRASGNVLLLERIVDDGIMRRLEPTSPLKNAALGTVSFQVDGTPGSPATGYPTRNPVFPTVESMPVATWRHHVGDDAAVPPRTPDFQLIWLYGPTGTVPTISLRRVFEPGDDGLPADLSDRSVFVGASDPTDRTAYDHFKVPLLFADSDMVGGVELAATAFLNLLHGHRMSAPPLPIVGAIVFGFTLAALIASQFVVGARWLLGVASVALGYAAVAVALFLTARLWLPVFVPMIIVTPIAILAAFSTRYSVARRMVERLAPRPFARELLKHPEIGRGASHLEEATIMFADMVGSTALAERLGEDAYRNVVNRYYSAATAAVEANDGMIVEYMGDGILALFTATVAGRDHAVKACRAAQELSASPMRRASGSHPGDEVDFLLRFGIHSGKVITGPTGAEHRYSFKALGDSVNVAARLEELGRSVPQDGSDIILLSQDTRQRAEIPDRELVPLGPATLRGRRHGIEIYRLRAGLLPAESLQL